MQSCKRIVLGSLLLSVACVSCGKSLGRGGPDMGPPMGGPPMLAIDPSDVTLDVISGQPAPTATFMVTYTDPSGASDVSNSTTFMVMDPTLGSAAGNVFTATGDHGGNTTIVAAYIAPSGTLYATATIHIKVHGSFQGSDCAGCAAFPDSNANPCPSGAAARIVYPSDGVLLPPNLNQFEIHFTQGSVAGTIYEVDFQNDNTDVRITTRCTGVTDSRGNPVDGACVLAIDPQWDFIAKSNKGGDPITISVRTSTDGACAVPSLNAPKMNIAEEDTAGGIYYWKSKFTPIGTGGDIWRKAFGDMKAEEKITPDTLSGNFTDYPCWGCHSLSRDGARMAINVDDSDSDDEYTDVSSGLFDVASKMFITSIGYAQGNVAGFQTFNDDHSLLIGSDGDGLGSSMAGGFGITPGATNVFYLWNGTDGTAANPAQITVGMMSDRPTMPDWSLDNKLLVFVIPTIIGWSGHNDDAHVWGGSIWTMAYNKPNFARPVELIKSNGDNNYYPSISPDGNWIVYNHVDKQKTPDGTLNGCSPKGVSPAGSCPNDSFSNPKARLYLTPPTVGSTPIDLALANGSPHGAQVDVSNSWPRWSPFVQKYKGNQLLWITFSSTRDYGVRVRNHIPIGGSDQVQCYPADSPEDPNGDHGENIAPNCQQPQIWMAAINISGGEMGQVSDPSYPAFWLPYQDITTHNHTAQWTSSVVTMPNGMCAKSGESCVNEPCCANEGICLANGTCGVP